jgi:protein-tyrosine-phosphatase
MAEAGNFEIVVICSGNRFRSPLVAAYLREATKALPVRVESAGTLDLGTLPALAGAVSAASEHGLDLSDHSSRFVGRVSLAAADLVLGFERMHVTTAVVDGGAPRERVFTLPELVSLLEQDEPLEGADPIERARAAVAQAGRARGSQSGLRFPEVADPIGTSPRAQRRTAEELIDLSGRLVAALFGLPVEGAGRRPWRERLRGRG